MKEQTIAITMGDPAGIGPEIVVKALNDSSIQKKAKLILIGDKKTLEQALEITEVGLDINIIQKIGDYKKEVINLIDLANVKVDKLEIGTIQGMCGQAAYEYIKEASRLALAGKVDAIATGPINKESLKAGGVDYIGHTEMLADLTNTRDPLTMFQVFNLRVFFLSRHVSLKKACELVTKERLIDYIERSYQALERLGVKDGKFAIAALNPHGGEHGLFGYEEVDQVVPAIEEARQKGYNIVGPIPADSVFHQALNGKYDAVLSLYHDQGHIATKMVDFERTISITNSLPFLRTSVDHGTAFDIAGKNKASAVSMEEAIRLAIKYASSFNN
ncbi:4-hydroxythreonine-4-phosphate dehydrogenase [Halobacteroides halobius DSM 5150]|uniref:4-hydroxythreonine-4-phosphate dehydrogenase n=1 Tax=Halobacteroides halobius (strain ATCC 35273 / DSM 5150 / MD-1) TaxID=748449 RepID=L0KAL8_HALHC|nr:4-hydroxythreonine-4-phosphate dehydrogenase PdxA [Halobacteroides halobius]AGB41143.1 4-hydroxythreonine-4-phosphate dehydrogenase [Halobacteroides halobius DSM 5150]